MRGSNKFKDIVLASGTYFKREKGEKIPGLDLGRFVRDILNQCGYICYSCDDSCAPVDKLTKIGELEAEIESLKNRLLAAGI